MILSLTFPFRVFRVFRGYKFNQFIFAALRPLRFALFSIALSLTARADEGMWLFNQPSRHILQDRYQFDATEAWLDHLQKASIRFNSGGSGSFVRADGLLTSNLHVGRPGRNTRS